MNNDANVLTGDYYFHIRDTMKIKFTYIHLFKRIIHQINIVKADCM